MTSRNPGQRSPVTAYSVADFGPQDLTRVVSYAVAHPEGTVLTVWVVPGSSRPGVAGVHGDALRVRVGAPPERGRANEEVVALIAALTGAGVTLVAGGSSRRKRLLVAGLAPDVVGDRLLGVVPGT